MSKLETTGLLLIQSNRVRSTDRWQAQATLAALVRNAVTDFWNKYLRYRSARVEGQRVSKLSDHLLEDIGITRQQAIEIDRRKAR